MTGGYASGAAAVVLSLHSGAVEVLQLRAATAPLFGDPSTRDRTYLFTHLLDPYNMVDVSALLIVLLTTVGGLASPGANALAIFLLLLKLVGSLRALPSFGFLISMLLSTVYMMKDFLLLMTLLIAGFAAIFRLLEAKAPGEEDVVSFGDELWVTALLTVLGEFEPETYYGGHQVRVLAPTHMVCVNVCERAPRLLATAIP